MRENIHGKTFLKFFLYVLRPTFSEGLQRTENFSRDSVSTSVTKYTDQK
jgi:hypothetical protein